METTIEDTFSTELNMAAADVPAGGRLEIRKRFQFSYDPAETRGLFLESAEMQLLQPAGADFRYVSSIKVYAVDADGVEVFLGSYDKYVPDSIYADFDIAYTGDLRPFAHPDTRVVMLFVIEASSWAGALPPEGLSVEVEAAIRIEI